MIKYIRIVKYQILYILNLFPTIYLFIRYHRKKTKSLVVTKDTQLVIEGYPRSGNTFAVLAIEKNNNLRIAHHLHSPTQILKATKHGVPAMVLIRNPVESAISVHIKTPEISLNKAIKLYIIFYKSIKKLSNRVLIVDFNEVISNFDKVIKKLNLKYKLKLNYFEHNEDNVNTIFAKADRLAVKRKENLLTHTSRPNAGRGLQKDYYKKNIHKYVDKKLLNTAYKLYNYYHYLSL